MDNIVVQVSNYATEELHETLNYHTKLGYKLVNAVLAPNKYDVNVMYLYFTKD